MQGALHQSRCLGGGEPAPFIAVGGKRRVDCVRRDRFAQLGPGSAVAGPRAFDSPGGDVPGDGGQDDRMPVYVDAKMLNLPLTWMPALRMVSLTSCQRCAARAAGTIRCFPVGLLSMTAADWRLYDQRCSEPRQPTT